MKQLTQTAESIFGLFAAIVFILVFNDPGIE